MLPGRLMVLSLLIETNPAYAAAKQCFSLPTGQPRRHGHCAALLSSHPKKISQQHNYYFDERAGFWKSCTSDGDFGEQRAVR